MALIFMHLNSEKSMIYKVLIYTVFFAIGMMFLTLLALYDPIISPFDHIINPADSYSSRYIQLIATK